MQSLRQSYYQHQPSTMMTSSAISRGRSLTPPSFKHNARLPPMNHLRSQEFYPPYYPHHPAVFADPAYYRTYGDPYLMQRLPPPPPSSFIPSTSPPPSSSSRAYRNMYSSSGMDRYPTVMSHRRTQESTLTRRSPSRSRRRYEFQLLLSFPFISRSIYTSYCYFTISLLSFSLSSPSSSSSSSSSFRPNFDDRLYTIVTKFSFSFKADSSWKTNGNYIKVGFFRSKIYSNVLLLFFFFLKLDIILIQL
jgi:hypothetical protein